MADLTDEINKSSREFSETTKKFNAEFKSLIGNVRDVNQSLGILSDLRKTKQTPLQVHYKKRLKRFSKNLRLE